MGKNENNGEKKSNCSIKPYLTCRHLVYTRGIEIGFPSKRDNLLSNQRTVRYHTGGFPFLYPTVFVVKTAEPLFFSSFFFFLQRHLSITSLDKKLSLR